MKWAVTRLCRPTGYGDYLWDSRPMFSAVGLFLGLKSKISHEQNVIYFQFYIRLPNCRLLGSIIFKKSPIRSIPLSILYRLFFETQGRKYGRILSWLCYYVQVNSLRLKSTVGSKWGSKHLWEYLLFCCRMVTARKFVILTFNCLADSS